MRTWTIYGSKWDSSNFVQRLKEEFIYEHSVEGQVEQRLLMRKRIYQIQGQRLTRRQEQEYRKSLLAQEIESRRELEELSGSKFNGEAVWNKAHAPAYEALLRGDVDAAYSMWVNLEDHHRLKLTLHLWELAEQQAITKQVWATVLRASWQRGKTGCLLLKARLTQKQIVAMFGYADPASLMVNPGEFEAFQALGEKVQIWRGASTYARHASSGISWSTNPLQAEWFAYRAVREKGGEPVLIQAVASKADILAKFDYEDEIVLNPKRATTLNIVETQRLSVECDSSRMDELRELLHEDEGEALEGA